MIPLAENNDSFDCTVRKNRKALLNSLIHLRPQYCLEIGSYIFQSSSVFSYYFNKYGVDGHLITADVAKWTDASPPTNVTQVMVYPHVNNITDFHGGINVYYIDYKEILDGGSDSIVINWQLINEAMIGYNIHLFDFVFVDGDHTEKSFMADLHIAKKITRPNGYVLIDDINDPGHEQKDVYHNYLKPKNSFYEFEDWADEVGMALIQAKDLTL